MAKQKETTKQVKTAVSKLKAPQKPQAQKSSGQPKKGSHYQKCLASYGSDDLESLGANPEKPHAWQRKKIRQINVNKEKVEEKDNKEKVKYIGDDADSKEVEQEQVSSL